MATQSSLDLAVDVKRGMKSKVEMGWRPVKAPLGYNNDPAGLKGQKKVFNDPLRFEIVRKIWDEFLTGKYTVKQIVSKATDEWGLRNKYGGKLSIGGGYKLLSNTFYYGEYTYKGELVEGKHEKMITKQEFDAVQKIMGRAGKPRPKYKRLPFAGLIRCGECNSMYSADEKFKFLKRENKTKQLIYHRCGKNKKDTVCHQKPIKYEDLAGQIEMCLDSITIPQEFLTWAIEVLRENNKIEESTHTGILASHQKNYTACLQRIDNLINMFVSQENINRELLTDDEYKNQKNSLMTEKTKIESQIRNIEQGVNQWVDLTEKTFNFATYARVWFDKGDFEQKTNILRALGKNFTVTDGKLHIDLEKPFLTLKNGLETEPLKTAKLEPLVLGVTNRKNAPLGSVYSQWSG